MKALTLIVASAATVLPSALDAQDYASHIRLAQAALQQQDHAKAVDAFKAAFEIQQDVGQDLVNAAGAAAQIGESAMSLEWLRKGLLDANWNVPLDIVFEGVPKSKALQPLRETEEWAQLMADVDQKLVAWKAHPDRALQVELEAIYRDDQGDRQSLDTMEKEHGRDSEQVRALWKRIAEKDAANLARVSAILDAYGWLGPERVGYRANNALFLVIQHADLASQQKYLPLMRAAATDGKLQLSSLALLEDRIALREGRPQTYGSQIARDLKTGDYYVQALEDPERVDERRASVGLPPIADYLKRWKISWDVEDYKKRLPQLRAALKPTLEPRSSN